MSKIIIKACIKQNGVIQEKIETPAILQNNKITYLNNKIVTKLDIKKQELRRITEEFELIIDFKNELIITDYKECSLDLRIRIIKKQIEQNRISIKYEMIDTKDIFEYEITWRKYETGIK